MLHAGGDDRPLTAAATVTAAIGLLMAGAGGVFIASGISTLRSRDLGLGGVGLAIGLILVAALVVVPGVLDVALFRPMRRGRPWAIRLAMSLASLHLLLVILLGVTALRHADAWPLIVIAMIASLLSGYIWWLWRCLRCVTEMEGQPRGFEVLAAQASEDGRGPCASVEEWKPSGDAVTTTKSASS